MTFLPLLAFVTRWSDDRLDHARRLAIISMVSVKIF